MGSTVVCAFASHRDDTFKNLEHKPKLWPQLLRGRGLMASRGPYCDKQCRRLTVEKIRIRAESLPFLLDTGSRGSFISTFVLPKSRFEDYDEPSMKLLANLMFAETVQQCWQIFPNSRPAVPQRLFWFEFPTQPEFRTKTRSAERFSVLRNGLAPI